MLTLVMFLGGWVAPVAPPFFLDPGLDLAGHQDLRRGAVPVGARATFPRYRYDQIMRLGWKIFIPVTLVWLVVVGLWIQSPWNIWK